VNKKRERGGGGGERERERERKREREREKREREREKRERERGRKEREKDIEKIVFRKLRKLLHTRRPPVSMNRLSCLLLGIFQSYECPRVR